MYSIEKTNEFDKWLRKLKDLKAKAKILLRLQRIETEGHFGDHKQVGNGISELKIDSGKGYRVYYKKQGERVIILLLGGNKSTQQSDIKKAKELFDQLN